MNPCLANGAILALSFQGYGAIISLLDPCRVLQADWRGGGVDEQLAQKTSSEQAKGILKRPLGGQRLVPRLEGFALELKSAKQLRICGHD